MAIDRDDRDRSRRKIEGDPAAGVRSGERRGPDRVGRVERVVRVHRRAGEDLAAWRVPLRPVVTCAGRFGSRLTKAR